MRYIPDTKEELKVLCDDLTINLGDIDTSKITDMSGLFKDSKRTKEQFSGIESWDVSNVENMHEMFYSARHIVWHDLGKWDVSKVKDFSFMFAYVTGEEIDTQNGIDYYPPDGVWNCNVKNWDVSGGLKFKNMFYSSNFQEKIPNWNMKVDDPEFDIQTEEDFFTIFDNSLYDTNSADAENWQTDYPQVLTKKLGLFYYDEPIINIRFNENISEQELQWIKSGNFPGDMLDPNIADYLRNAFTLEIYIDQELKGWIEVNMSGNEETGQISLWPVACHLGDIDNYTECGEEISLDLFKSSDYKKAIENKLREIALDFYGDELNTIPGLKEKLSKSFKYHPKTKEELKTLCDDLSVNLGEIDTSEITDMNSLFFESKREDFSGIEKWNTSKVTNINSMFSNSKFNADISNWDVSNVQYMFEFLDDVDYKYDLSCWLNPDNPNGLKLENIYPDAVEFNNERYIEGNSYVNPTGDFSDIFIYYSTPCDALFSYENTKHPDMAKVLIKSQNIFKTVNWKAIDDETRDWIIQCCNKSVLQDFLKDDSISNLQKLDVSMMDDFSNLCECCPERTDFSGIEKWHMSNAKDVSFMFTGTKFNQDVSLWRLSDGCNTTGLFNGCNISNENLHKAANAWGLDPRESALLVTDADLVPKDYNLNPRITDLGTGREVKQDISWNNHRDDAFRALDEKLERISRDLEETKAEIKKYRGR